MAYDNIQLNYDYDFKGEIHTPEAKTSVGDTDNGLMPYHMLFGALGSCFYSTFLMVSKKMRLTFKKAELEVSGYKTDPNQKILDHVKIDMVVYEPSNEDRLMKASKLGAQYCSIHEIISNVAEIELNVTFK